MYVHSSKMLAKTLLTFIKLIKKFFLRKFEPFSFNFSTVGPHLPGQYPGANPVQASRITGVLEVKQRAIQEHQTRPYEWVVTRVDPPDHK